MISPKELSVLRWLALGSVSKIQICEREKISLACLYVHCQHIRQKTGIKTKNPRECEEWIRAHPRDKKRANLPVVPSQRQFQILDHYASGMEYDQIAKTMGIGRQTVITQMSAARFRAGLPSPRPFEDRRQQVREYLANTVGQKITMEDKAFQ